ncbi:hypothetical protein I6B53_04910 [Schaalia sp. 19OD2882]|nr:hypothetical protein I6B53_04910 [Schaalia sp. 19OD2882]
MVRAGKELWRRFEERFGSVAQFVLFMFFANAITVVQLVLMPILKWVFGKTSLVDIPVQALPIGGSGDHVVYMFDYAAGHVDADGLGGGLAYFLAVQITLFIGQVLDFFAQRNITFRSNTSIRVAAFWYAIAYILITVAAAALQVAYKAPVYSLMQNWFGQVRGQSVADVVTMLINSTIAFWVFYLVFKVIFKRVPEGDEDAASRDETPRPAPASRS